MNTTGLNVVPGQLPLTFSRQQAAQCCIATSPDLFRPGFGSWMGENWGLYLAFEVEANRIAQRRAHWSANTILEYLRHETALRDAGSVWKIDDRWTSSIARLYAVLNPGHGDLFEYRVRAGGVVRRAA